MNNQEINNPNLEIIDQNNEEYLEKLKKPHPRLEEETSSSKRFKNQIYMNVNESTNMLINITKTNSPLKLDQIILEENQMIEEEKIAQTSYSDENSIQRIYCLRPRLLNQVIFPESNEFIKDIGNESSDCSYNVNDECKEEEELKIVSEDLCKDKELVNDLNNESLSINSEAEEKELKSELEELKEEHIINREDYEQFKKKLENDV